VFTHREARTSVVYYLRYVLRERGEREFAADTNEFALAAFAARNRVLPICGELEFEADNIPIFFVF